MPVHNRWQSIRHAVENGSGGFSAREGTQLCCRVGCLKILPVSLIGSEPRDFDPITEGRRSNGLAKFHPVLSAIHRAHEYEMTVRITRELALQPGFQQAVIELGWGDHAKRTQHEVIFDKSEDTSSGVTDIALRQAPREREDFPIAGKSVSIPVSCQLPRMLAMDNGSVCILQYREVDRVFGDGISQVVVPGQALIHCGVAVRIIKQSRPKALPVLDGAPGEKQLS